jgi:hypothetical protein
MLATGLEPITQAHSTIQLDGDHRTPLPEFVDENTAAKIIERPLATLRRWRFERRYLTFYRHGGLVRYRVADLTAFLADGVVEVSA